MPSLVTPLSPQAVGISVEFVSHLTCAFAHSTKPTRVERAAEATITMGSKVGAARPRGHPRVLSPHRSPKGAGHMGWPSCD